MSGMQSELAILDAHCHIDLYDDHRTVVAMAEQMHIHTIAVTNAPSVFFYTRDLTQECQFVRAAAGFHPELVYSRRAELHQLWPLLESTRYIGEVGLDYVTSDHADRTFQRKVFSEIVERCASLGDKVLTIHSRRAAADVIATLGNFPGKAILHWFSGTLSQLKAAADVGCYFSVNPAMVLSASGRKLISAMPKVRVLTETDGPFVQVDSRPAEPPDTGAVVFELGRLWNIDPKEARSVVAENSRGLLAP